MSKLIPREGGVVIRMYRIGHGDCFLLAFPRKQGGDPFYVLIDCGYKPGSPKVLAKTPGEEITDEEIVKDIAQMTGEKIDLFIVTHEHQDHVNAIKNFQNFTIEEAWFAWTEDPANELANELRKRHHDQLLGLLSARNKLAAMNMDEAKSGVEALDNFLAFEMGGTDDGSRNESGGKAKKDPNTSVNKQAMKMVKELAANRQGVRFLSPGEEILQVGDTDVRAFVLGPPLSADLLGEEDPVGSMGFPRSENRNPFSFASAANEDGPSAPPFGKTFILERKEADKDSFFVDHYGFTKAKVIPQDNAEVSPDADWRRIEEDWLQSAENIALALNTGINNTSLVLAFELPKSKKVLLFIGDAQVGNWKSWTDCSWQDGTRTITCKDLLARTVLYKVGHHGSHNATLAGKESDSYANLSWMGAGRYGSEFTAMITAVNKWALAVKPKPWIHPLPSIKQALMAKAQGRVFQTDEPAPQLQRPTEVMKEEWDSFVNRHTVEPMYFEYHVIDS